MERWARVPTSVLQRPELSSADKIVFVALCSFADKLGRCFPKRATLAEYTSLSVRTISTSISNLTAAGVITQQQRTGTTPLYIVVPLAPIARVEDTPANIARVASPAAYVNESGALADKVRRLFSEAFPGHGVGNTNYVQKYIRERGREYRWYLELFEVASKRPFLRGENDKRLKMPLSFILREADEILYHGKYAPWTETAEAVAEYIKGGGEIKP